MIDDRQQATYVSLSGYGVSVKTPSKKCFWVHKTSGLCREGKHHLLPYSHVLEFTVEIHSLSTSREKVISAVSEKQNAHPPWDSIDFVSALEATGIITATETERAGIKGIGEAPCNSFL